ncbi:MAG: trypsin-like peptidase domain-containing protein [Bacteroidales bacterium]|nr:trypsin-like peptidase domain-containing protein [Bacteroidales bacterium]
MLLSNVLSFFLMISCTHSSPAVSSTSAIEEHSRHEPVYIQSTYPDLTYAAEKSVHAVVHIKTEFVRKTTLWDLFFDDSYLRQYRGYNSSKYPIMASGSGVIISPDGYIVTNNHVVEKSDHITVTLNNKREYEAVIVGLDPYTDLALLKIDASNLPTLSWGNSDEVKIGEWVLAVGNPMNLNSTVTAGIVSAKARNLNTFLQGGKTIIEAYIQTDAAVNRGNSGGALVNARGDLIGINAAIATGNGYFTGYSFAIPANIAKKIADDLKNYGEVRRAALGTTIMEVTNEMAEELHLAEVKGLYITDLSENGSARHAGLQVGDILLEIEKHPVNSVSELREVVAQYSPGDELHIKFLRKNNEKNIVLTLK